MPVDRAQGDLSIGDVCFLLQIFYFPKIGAESFFEPLKSRCGFVFQLFGILFGAFFERYRHLERG
jgi:hypothetical protein